MNEKNCFHCSKSKSLDCFGKDRHTKSGLAAYCKVCANEIKLKSYHQNSQELNKIRRESYHNNREKRTKVSREKYYPKRVSKRQKYAKNNESHIKAYQKEYRMNKVDKRKDYSLQTNYGITLEIFNQIVEEQKGICAINSGSCNPIVNKKHNLNVDHDHEVGNVRGLLCSNCNTAIGLLGENIEAFQRCVEYLIQHKTNPRIYNIKDRKIRKNINHIKKRILCVETGKIFDSITQASLDMRLHRSTIRKVLNEEHAQTGGYTFKYLDENKNSS